jgi:hypothetical protein
MAALCLSTAAGCAVDVAADGEEDVAIEEQALVRNWRYWYDRCRSAGVGGAHAHARAAAP